MLGYEVSTDAKKETVDEAYDDLFNNIETLNGEVMSESTAVDLLTSFAGFDTVLEENEAVQTNLSIVLDVNSLNDSKEREKLEEIDKQQTDFNEKNRETAFLFPPTEDEIVVGKNEKTQIIHSSINIVEDDTSQEEVSEVNLKGQDIEINLDSDILKTLAEKINTAVKQNSTQTNSCKVQMVFREQANFNALTSDFDSGQDS